IGPAGQIPILRRPPANLEIQRRINEFKQLGLNVSWSKQLQQPLARSDRAAGIPAHIDYQAGLRKFLICDKAPELVHKLVRVVHIETKQPHISELSTCDLANLAIEHFFEALAHQSTRRSKKSSLDFIDLGFLDVDCGALLPGSLGNDRLSVAVVNQPFGG